MKSRNFLGSKMLWIIVLAVFFGCDTANSQSGETERSTPESALFMGNSYIYFWNLPQQVSSIAQSRSTSLNTVQSTEGGSNWSDHWRGVDDIQSTSMIESGNYDAVVIQNHSLSAIERRDSLLFYGKKFADLIKAQDADVYLYMTWARENDPSMMDDIENAYVELGQETGATVVPVGLAWKRVQELRPQLDLYDPDGSHPSPVGSYLTACVFYTVFTGETLQGVPERLTYTDINGENLYLNILPEETAEFLQETAEEVVNDFQSSN